MLKNDPNYQRLKFGGTGLTGSSTLWLARDHLLVVEVTGYAERYRRFYFRDIQTVVLQKSAFRLWWNLGLAICLAASLLISLAASSPVGATGLGVCAIFMILFGLPLLINTLRGPTCTVSLRTAVQTQKILNLNRWNKAGQLIALLTPIITAAQVAEPLPAGATGTDFSPPAGG